MKFERRNHGRNHSYYLDGEKLPGATTVLNKGYPKGALVNWAAKASAQEVLDRWDELLTLPPSERFELIRTAPNRDRDQAAHRGTEVHRYAQQLARGAEVQVPDELVGHVDAYLRFLEEWQPDELLVEAPVLNTRWRYCGTVDAVADLADGQRWLLDLKTTRSGVFRETALQLTAYRNADFYLDSNGEPKLLPLPRVDGCAAVWLRADRSYEFTPVEAGPEEFSVFLAALEIARFEGRDDIVGAPLEAPALEATA